MALGEPLHAGRIEVGRDADAGEIESLRVQSAARGLAARFSGSTCAKRCANICSITMPNTATENSPAVRDTALLTPDAIPAQRSSTAFITVVVSGAMLIAMPTPSTTIAGKNVVQ